MITLQFLIISFGTTGTYKFVSLILKIILGLLLALSLLSEVKAQYFVHLDFN